MPWITAFALRAGDRLSWAQRERAADRQRVVVVPQACAARDVVEVQVAAGGEDLEAAGAVGVAEPHMAVGGGGAGAAEHGGATRPLQLHLYVADAPGGDTGAEGAEVDVPRQVRGRDLEDHAPRVRGRLAQRVGTPVEGDREDRAG